MRIIKKNYVIKRGAIDLESETKQKKEEEGRKWEMTHNLGAVTIA